MNIDFNQDPLNLPIPRNSFEEQVIQFLMTWFSSEKKVSVQTSGSTGVPKILNVEKVRMMASAQMTCDFLKLRDGDRAFLCLPIEYISGKMMVVRSIYKKLQLSVAESSLKPLETLQQPVHFCAMTPLQVAHSLDKIPLIKKLIIGGAAVSESLKNEIRNSAVGLENKIYETYGMSETLSHIALKEIYPKDEDYFNVFEGVKISTDQRGCLKIEAPRLYPEILQTNDIVEIINQHQFRFLGRADNIINSGGAKIFPEELESLVKKYISNEVVFLGIPDEKFGQKLIAVVEEPNLRNRPILSQKINQMGYKKSFHRPKDIIFMEKIPRTPNGKVDRRGLGELLKSSD